MHKWPYSFINIFVTSVFKNDHTKAENCLGQQIFWSPPGYVQPPYRLIASALSDSLIASVGGTIPPKISETTGRMTMKFLPDVKLS